LSSSSVHGTGVAQAAGGASALPPVWFAKWTKVSPKKLALYKDYFNFFLDEREDSINDGTFSTDENSPLHLRDVPASYHGGAGGFSFADGHAEIKRWRDDRTMTPIQPNGSWSGTPYIPSPRNQDIFWMQERSTRKKSLSCRHTAKTRNPHF